MTSSLSRVNVVHMMKRCSYDEIHKVDPCDHESGSRRPMYNPKSYLHTKIGDPSSFPSQVIAIKRVGRRDGGHYDNTPSAKVWPRSKNASCLLSGITIPMRT